MPLWIKKVRGKKSKPTGKLLCGLQHRDKSATTRRRLCRRKTHLVLEVGDKVIAVLVLLEAGKGHLCAGDVLEHTMYGQRGCPSGDVRGYLTFLGFSGAQEWKTRQ